MDLIKLENGVLTILTGKPDMGKSTITVYDCSENLKAGKRVMFFSYEYCQSIIYHKLVSHFKISWAQLFNLNVIEASGLNLKSLVNIVRNKKKLVDVVYIDFLDLLKQSTYFGENESEEESLKQIQEIVKELSKLAKEMDIPIVLLSQIGSSTDFEKSVERLNSFGEKTQNEIIKMFIGKGNVIDKKIDYDDVVHIILVEGYNLRHYSSINIQNIYKEKE